METIGGAIMLFIFVTLICWMGLTKEARSYSLSDKSDHEECRGE